MAAKIFRINYKSDFILTLNSDAGWMTPFCIKFWTGAPSQAFFVGWDGTTYTHCSYDPSEPTKLLVQFDDHHLPIGDLKFQIAYHFTVADFPNDTEDEVINPSSITTEIDGQEYQVMLDFTGETAPEIEFSLPAYANEAQRIANEEERIAHEQQRINDEQQRIANEETRQAHEAQRIAQETARVNEFATLKAQSQAATSAANTAAALANEKAQLAADKSALAQAAATLANQKAQLAADKAALANAAAQLANEKAALAQQKAEYAQQQGGYAKDQGDYAKNQGDYAKEQGDTALADHQRADADHGIAVDDHTQAGNDHTRAESDHGIAVDDHTQAGNDHIRAESDHGIASDDHTQAGNDHTRAESDHGIASDDHTQAGNDHTRAESDHTRAESDHAAVEVYIDSLGAFDISAYHATGGVLAKYSDLTEALGTNGANIPDALRKGGMSVKYVDSSDNKYVQYLLTKNEWSANEADWQKMNLEEEVKQLGQEIYDHTTVSLTPTGTGSYIPKSDGTTKNGGSTWKRHDYNVANIEDVITVTTDATPAGQPTQYVDCVYYLLKDANSNVLLAGTDIHSANPSPFQINLANYPGASVLQVTVAAATLSSSVSYETKTDRFIKVADVVDNLSSQSEKDPLSAKQGKVLSEAVSGKISTSDIEDSLTSSSSNKVLSAKQGKVLNERIDNELFDEETVTLTPPTSYGSYIPKSDGTTINGGSIWRRADYTVSGINKVITITTDAPKSTNASQFVGCVYYILKDASANVLAVGPDIHENNPSPATLDLSLYPAATTLQIITDGTNKQTSVSYVDVEPKYIPSDNIVDNLLSSDSTKPLSAKQGKVLNDKIDNFAPNVLLAMPPVIEVVGKKSDDSIYGNKLQIYYRDIIGAVDPFKYQVKPICVGGKIKHRHFDYDAKDKLPENVSFKLQLLNDSGTTVAEKDTTIKVIAPPSSPSSNKNILLLGSSTLGTGTVAHELNRRLCETSGSNSTYTSEPKGLGLSNVSFVGRRVGSRYNQVLQESAGGAGYSKKYAIDSGNQIRFYVDSGDVEVGDIYTDGVTNYTIAEDNVASVGGGNFLCAEGTDPIAASGTLTKVSGGGDSTITYTSYFKESGNPFWDRTLSTPGLNFQKYADEYCNGTIDMIVSLMTGNDLSEKRGDISTILNNYVKPFVRKYHQEFPNGKFVFGIQPPYSIYGDSQLTYDMKLWTIKYAIALYEMAADNEFSSYFSVAHTLQLFDNENMFPLHDEPVSNRLPNVSEKETINGTHPTGAGGQFQIGQDEAGCLTLADGLYYAICAVL